MSTRERQVPDDETIGTLERLWAADHGLQALSKRMLGRIGVTGPQRFVVRVVGQEAGLTAGELARRLHLHPSTLTGILRRLVSQGLLQRLDDPRDQRRVRLRLTPRGAELDRVRHGTAEAAMRATLSKLSPEEAATFRNVLEQLAIELESAAKS
ncbi:MAG: MarR family winged helix-turn-helix transcriptional regulator [Myxococcota bacterium]